MSSNLLADNGTKILPSFSCRSVKSNNTYFRNTSHCQIEMKFNKGYMLFEESFYDTYFDVYTESEDALAYGVGVYLEADTGIGYPNFDLNNRLSWIQFSLIPNTDYVLKGTDGINFGFTVLGSYFSDENNKYRTGLQVVDHSFEGGSFASPDEIYVKYGLNARVALKYNKEVVRTDWIKKQQFASFFANLMSTVTGFMGIFGTILLVIEVILSFDLPFIKYFRRFIDEDGMYESESSGDASLRERELTETDI